MSPDYRTYPDGSYAVFFHNAYNSTISTHSIDRVKGLWWDGTKIIDEYEVEALVKLSNGPLYRMGAVFG